MKDTNLRTTRDLLRPKLISGELDLSTLPERLTEPRRSVIMAGLDASTKIALSLPISHLQ
jgi:hypothetical protein